MAVELPRLAGFCRAVSNVSAHWATHIPDDPEDLFRKKKEQKLNEAKIYSLESIINFFVKHSNCSPEKIKDLIRDLRDVAQKIVGSESTPQDIEGSTIFLINTLKGCDLIGKRHTQELQRTFGSYSDIQIKTAFDLVKQLMKTLSSDALDEFLLNGFQVLDVSDDDEEELFGTKIKVVDIDTPDNSHLLLPVRDSDETGSGSYGKLSFKFDAIASNNWTGQSSVNEKPTEKFGIIWLETEMKKFCYGDSCCLDPLELSMSALDLLKSNATNEALQNGLFELLGFDRYELIQAILEHRQSIVHSKPKPRFDQQIIRSKLEENKIVPMQQVIIQTEAEKQLSKQIRKDEKRIQKNQSAQSKNEDEFIVDANYLKMMREAQLISARNTPLFSQPRAATTRTSYPNVYDSFSEVTSTAAYISGHKLCLPANNKRYDCQKYEEITIPAVKRDCSTIIRENILTEALDRIGKIAFAQVKSLNLIQSAVFDVAYKTNENMLVCAPTGAGKTNIAMLTILHEIKNNMDGINIRKDKFKIVYVAPMKALASEMVRNFGERLKPLGIVVKELTGDMQLTKTEIMQTQMLVTTPEKWDVVTRKSTGDIALTQLVKLLILDEVHLIDSDRGPVVETLVARTLRQVETSQTMIRILGLSATLPNYVDVARFLKVNLNVGLFFFDDRFRPVPLSQTFIGVKAVNSIQQMHDMDEVCYEKVADLVKKGNQVMVFVHARVATVRTAMVMRDLAKQKNQLLMFANFTDGLEKNFGEAQKQMSKSRNKQLRDLFNEGFAIHHAGMLRSDRNYVEKYFREKLIRVLVCTSTLAWGVNLPARAVIIKGTEVYDSKKGAYVDLGVLDVMQIFGRAGRPQYDTEGHGTIITTHEKLSHFLTVLTRQHQIESNFHKKLADNLNAEISLGTVTNVEEAVIWLSYTYFYIRMLTNPHNYGIRPADLMDDPLLLDHRRKLIIAAANVLSEAKMVNYDEKLGYLSVSDQGRTASDFYISCETVKEFSTTLMPITKLHDSDILNLIGHANEFEQLKVRQEEMTELDMHLQSSCQMAVKGGTSNTQGKVNILLQSYLSRAHIETFSLVSDLAYVVQNSTRILRYLFEVAIKAGKALQATEFLNMCKMVERQQWFYETPLRQFHNEISQGAYEKIERMFDYNITDLLEYEVEELGVHTRCHKEKKTIKSCLHRIPNLKIETTVQPITDKILRLTLNVTPDFQWSKQTHGMGMEAFWILIEDPDTDTIYHYEYFLLSRKQVYEGKPLQLVFTIPLGHDVQPNEYIVHAMSDRWLGSDRSFPICFKNLILPHHHQPQTELLDLEPLPVTVLNNTLYQSLYKFEYFNPIQTQIFHTLFHSDNNVLLGAPTGSGKTIAAEIAMFRVFDKYPGAKVVYVAPLKALVRERIKDWKERFVKILKMNVIELTGDVTPDARAIETADVIVTTPEKWDGISRSWQTRDYVKSIALIVIDEIHLLGESRGPVLEVIVSRTNFISAYTEKKVRIVGLSTALANATDLANWLGIKNVGLYNFKASVRPVPLETHVSGYPGKHYCPRMAVMNKPTFQAIRKYSPDKPSLVFVSSRRQTRLTALDLIAYLAAEENPRQWIHLADDEVQHLICGTKDQNLKLTLAFGIGLHHAGLHEQDRKMVEALFLYEKIQVLIATATLAWGVNLPAHLVVIKGTEYFDGKTKRYIDFPVTDVLQMMGRAGRPQFDTEGVAVILVHDIKKDFYKKFLYSPFPVESSLVDVLPDHINAEIAAGTISSKQQCLDYLTWTYYFRRLLQNPGYYGLESQVSENINDFLSKLVDKSLANLENSDCIQLCEDNRTIEPTTLGRIASYYYLSYISLNMFHNQIQRSIDIDKILWIVCEAKEFDELPVRHNEDSMNEDLAKQQGIRIELNKYAMDNPHTKASLLLQSHFSRLGFPCSDYYTDLKSVLDNAIRVIQALIDVTADRGFLEAALSAMTLLQMIIQARWYDDSSLLTLPHVQPSHLNSFRFSDEFVKPDASSKNTGSSIVDCLPQLISLAKGKYDLLSSVLSKADLNEGQIYDISKTLGLLPVIEMRCSIKKLGCKSSGEPQPLPMHPIAGRVPPSHYMKVETDTECSLNVQLIRRSTSKRDNKAITEKFPKPKDEGWFLVLGNIDTKELISMKRVPYIKEKSTHRLVFFAPEKKCQVIYTLFLISDSYLGLDQQYSVYLETVKDDMQSSESSSDSEYEDEL